MLVDFSLSKIYSFNLPSITYRTILCYHFMLTIDLLLERINNHFITIYFCFDYNVKTCTNSLSIEKHIILIKFLFICLFFGINYQIPFRICIPKLLINTFIL